MEEIDLIELLKMFWRKKYITLAIIFIFFICGVIYTTKLVKPVFTSTTSLLLATSNDSQTIGTLINPISEFADITANSKWVNTYSEIIKSKSVLERVKSNLDIESGVEALKNKIKVTSVKDTEVIIISVTDKDNTFSEKVANEIAKVSIEYINEIYKRENIHILDKAEISEIPSNVNHKKDILIFTAIGFIFAVMYAYINSIFEKNV